MPEAKQKMSAWKRLGIGAFVVFIVIPAFLSMFAQTSSKATKENKPAATTVYDSLAYYSDVVKRIQDRYAENQKSLKDHYASQEGLIQTTKDFNMVGWLEAIRPSIKDCKNDDEKFIVSTSKVLAEKLPRQIRVMAASAVEENFVNGGMDVQVSAVGPENKTLKIKYALMSRPMVYQFENVHKMPEAARSRGFEKIIYTNGFSSALGETWTVDLKKE
jgi:hypothetical protein